MPRKNHQLFTFRVKLMFINETAIPPNMSFYFSVMDEKKMVETYGVSFCASTKESSDAFPVRGSEAVRSTGQDCHAFLVASYSLAGQLGSIYCILQENQAGKNEP